MSAEQYEKDLDFRMRITSPADIRGNQGNYGLFGTPTDGEGEYSAGYKKKKYMRGRKGKYYNQVEDED